MALYDAKIGLGALLSDSAMKIIESYTYIDTILLDQRKQQTIVAGEGAKGSANFEYENLHDQSEATRYEADSSISNGAIMGGFQIGGYGRGEMLNSQLKEANTSLTNSQTALDILDRHPASQPGVGRGAAPAAPAGSFSRYENETNGFKYGNPLTPEDERGLQSATTEPSRNKAIERAKAARDGFQKKVDSIGQEKAQFQQWYLNLGQALGTAASGTATMLKVAVQEAQAHAAAAKVATDFVNGTAQALTNTLDGLYNNTYGHIATLLQTLGSLVEADNMRG